MLKFALAALALLAAYLLNLDEKRKFLNSCQDSQVPRYVCVALWHGGVGITIYGGGLR
jgi:hypothetical protein